MTTSPENALYLVLKNAVDNANPVNPLYLADVHPTVYSVIDSVKTIRISNCESDFVPHYDESIEEYDARVPLQILVKVNDVDSPDSYVVARDLLRAVTMKVVGILLDDVTLGARVCDLKLNRAFRGWAKIQTAVYAVTILPIVVNPREL